MGFVGMLRFAVQCLGIVAWPVFGLGYPLCASIQAIETNSNSDTLKLITYWVSISVVLLFERAFELEWLTFWPYIKLMIVGCLVLPDFDGSLCVYQQLVHPCLSMDPRIITCQFKKLKELLYKKDDFHVEVERYVKENGTDALENLIASTKTSAEPIVAANEIKAVAVEDRLKFEPSNHQVPLKDSIASKITEKIEAESTKQLKLEQPKFPVRLKDSNTVETAEEKEVASTMQLKFEQPKLPVLSIGNNAVEITEKKEVSSTKQVRQIEPIIGQTENRIFLPLENINKSAPIIGSRDLHEILPPMKVQKIWTCAICQVTAQSEKVLNSHLQGNRHKSACEQLKVKNRTPKGEVSSASVGKKSNVTTETARIGVRDHTGISSPQNGQKAWTCVICQSTLKSQIDINSHLQGKQHQKACALLNSKNQASNSNAASASARKKTEIPVNNPKKCVISNNISLENKIHEAKKQGKQENPMKSLVVEIKNSKWWCALCNVSCTSEADMACHLRGNKHLDSRISRWQCTICDVSCTSEADMACHLRGNRHLDNRISKWQCTICDVSCTSEADMACHLRGNRHLDNRISKWQCTICDVSCTSEADMACHLRGKKHLDSRISRWQCTICDVSCTSEGDLHFHLNGNKHLSRIQNMLL
ncbi:HVA22-LIKE PROTEINS [Salix purpurea]|uniref:HVA22-LIKE PROTEINS n=1 Tax=Salix purpurea TaxID=77065 RepID=A0A9Q0VUQ1_SALPP|nr:HVA22-LIKE PROTEINS [Salix purpurea]